MCPGLQARFLLSLAYSLSPSLTPDLFYPFFHSTGKNNQFTEEIRLMAEQSSSRQIDYRTMRVVVGAIAFLLPPAVWLLSGIGKDLTSISISYWTGSRDVFVGALVAVGFFLSAYNGTGVPRDREFWISKAACIFAVCAAFFPTKGFSDSDIPARWVSVLAGAIRVKPFIVHYTTAILLFGCLIAFMWFFSLHAMEKNKPVRAYFYRAIGALMIAGIVVGLVVGLLGKQEAILFWVETWLLLLFGIGWLVAGSYRRDENSTKG